MVSTDASKSPVVESLHLDTRGPFDFPFLKCHTRTRVAEGVSVQRRKGLCIEVSRLLHSLRIRNEERRHCINWKAIATLKPLHPQSPTSNAQASFQSTCASSQLLPFLSRHWRSPPMPLFSSSTTIVQTACTCRIRTKPTGLLLSASLRQELHT